jgi:hypothetical protein
MAGLGIASSDVLQYTISKLPISIANPPDQSQPVALYIAYVRNAVYPQDHIPSCSAQINEGRVIRRQVELGDTGCGVYRDD